MPTFIVSTSEECLINAKYLVEAEDKKEAEEMVYGCEAMEIGEKFDSLLQMQVTDIEKVEKFK